MASLATGPPNRSVGLSLMRGAALQVFRFRFSFEHFSFDHSFVPRNKAQPVPEVHRQQRFQRRTDALTTCGLSNANGPLDTRKLKTNTTQVVDSDYDRAACRPPMLRK